MAAIARLPAPLSTLASPDGVELAALALPVAVDESELPEAAVAEVAAEEAEAIAEEREARAEVAEAEAEAAVEEAAPEAEAEAVEALPAAEESSALSHTTWVVTLTPAAPQICPAYLTAASWPAWSHLS